MRLCFWLIASLCLSTSMAFAQTSCMEFTNLSGIYGPSGPNGTPSWYEVFHTEGNIELSAQGFQNENGSINGSAFLSAGSNQFSGAFSMSNGVFLKTAPSSAMIYEFPVSDTVSFNYYENGTTINFAVNNEQVMVDSSFTDLPTAIGPGVTMTIVPNGNQGTITLTGYITRVIVGGNNLGIDDFCQHSDLTQTCLISQISATPQTCNNETFLTEIDLIYSDTGSMGFTVSANGTNFGTFSYTQLPITVGPLAGDGTTEWIFTVADVENTYCTNNENIGTVTCTTCAIENVYAEAFECTSNSTYSAYLEFTFSNNVSTMFDVYADGVLVGTFPYSSIPVFPNMPSSSNSSQMMTICDGGTSCCVDYPIIPVDCTPSSCSFSGFYSTPTCGTDGTFDIELGFTYTNQGTNFNVSGNGVDYGDFAYANLPITITGLAGDNSTNYIFNITDDTDSTCTGLINTGTVDCPIPCELSNMLISSVTCDSDSTNSFVLDFDFTDDSISLFGLTVEGNFIGSYSYASLPVTVSYIPGAGQSISVLVCDDSEPNCCLGGSYTSLDCAPPPCDISNLTATPLPCNGTLFNVEINFTPVNPASATFVLSGNGTTYGTYDYASLPVTIPFLPGDNTTNYEFFATDSSDPNCSAGVNIGTVYCEIPCDFSNLSVDSLLCQTDSTYNLILDLNYSGTVGSSFDLNMNGVFYGNFAYFDLPVTLLDLPANASTVNLDACDSNAPNCCTTVSYTAPDCTPAPVCAITNVTAITGLCEAGNFFVDIDFTVTDPVSTTFDLMLNGLAYGTFPYASLPIQVGSFAGDNATNYVFTITDTADPDCTNEVETGLVFCELPCDLSNMTVDSLLCESASTYSTVLDLAYSGTISSSFNLKMNGSFYGNFAYADLPFELNGLIANGETIVLQACDEEKPNCCTDLTYTAASCAPSACEIGNLDIEVLPCDEFGKYNAILDFDHSNTSGTFIVRVNLASYGIFNYADLPVTIGSFSGNGTDYTIDVEDNGPIGGCTSSFVMQGVDCPIACDISAVEVDAMFCTSDTTYSVFLDFNYSGGLSSEFKVNASNGQLVGTYAYTQLPVTINNFPSYGATPETITISDIENTDCIATRTFDALSCQPVLPCEISTISAVASDCDTAGLFFVTIDLTYANVGTNFSLTGNNGANYGNYSYVQLPITIGPLIGDGINEYEFFVADVTNPDCVNETTVGVIDCTTTGSCDITNLTAVPQDCNFNTGLFMIELDMTPVNGGTNFSVLVNGGLNGSFAYTELPVMIGPFFGDGVTNWDITVTDADSLNCTATAVVDPVSCTTQPCELSNLVVDPIECTSGTTISMVLDLDFANTTGGFEVFASTGSVGFFDYAALPITITDYPITGSATETLVVCDAMNPNCCTELNFTSLDCSNVVCSIDEVTVEVLDCDVDGSVSVIVDLVHNDAVADSFQLVGNGNIYGNYSYADLPVTVGTFEGDEVSIYEIIAIDLNNSDCVAFTGFGPIDCILDCELTELVAEPITCTSDSTYRLQLQFNYQDVSASGFEVFAQGMSIGTYSYADLPLDISDFPILATNEVVLNVCDTDNPNCCASVTYEALNCSGGCNIFEVITTPFGCDQGEYMVELDLEYQGVGSLGFQVFGNGENYGNFSYSDLPVNFGSFAGDGQTTYEFIVIDLENTTCFNFAVAEPFDCTIECEVSNLHSETICGDSTFMIELDFDYNNSSAEGFILNGNGVVYGTYSYDSLPVMVGPFEHGDLTDFEFVVTDMVNDNCSSFMAHGQVDCTVSSTENFLAVNSNIRYDFLGENVLINLEEPLGTDASIEVYNAAGMKVLTTELSAGHMEQRISISAFASGWYMVRMTSEDGQVALPFVKAR